MSNLSEIRCGGGGMLLEDGKFAFFIEVTIQGYQFTFESINSFDTEEEMLEQLEGCMQEFPGVIVESAKTKDFNLMEDFFEKWQIVKIIEKDPEEETGPSSGTVH